MQTESILRLARVIQETGLSRSTIWRLQREGRFPRPIKLSQRAIAWPASAIQQWIAERIAASVSDGKEAA